MSDTPKSSPSSASEPPKPKSRRMGLRHGVGDVARVAHWLLNDSGYTRKHAARDLRVIAKALNAEATYQWSDEDLDKLLGDAAHAKL